jgi:FkbM family methyltransferase
LTIPGVNRDAIGLAHHWQPNWKTSLIHGVLGRRPGKFLDIGANIGQTLLDYCASPHRPGYVGFEPNLHCTALISAIISANHLDDCVITPVGLSAENAILKLYFAEVFSTDEGASIVQELRPGKECRFQLVPCYRFDDIRDTLEMDAISLMKIDVEGAESLVLGGMTGTLQQLRPWMICEVLLRDVHADRDAYLARTGKLMEIVDRAGYAAMRIDKSPDGLAVKGFTPIDEFPDRVWTREQADDCDYLLVPGADRGQVEGGLLPAISESP